MAYKPQARRTPRPREPETRPSARERGYDTAWDKFSLHYRTVIEPLCRDCQEQGITTPSQHVHHIQKLRDRPEMKYELTNLIGLCEVCHNARTAKGE